MIKFIRKFASDTDGAVTVDWVVLTGAVVGLGIGVVALLLTGSNALGGKLTTSMKNAEVEELVLY